MYKLSMFQVLALVCTSFTPLMFWIYPRYAVQAAGVDGQWAVVGVILLGGYVAWIHGMLNKRFPKLSGAQMPPKVYGKWVGRIATSLFVPGYILFLGTSLFSFSVTLRTFLPATPRVVTMGSLVLMAMIGAFYGLEAIARTASIVMPVTIMILYVTYIFISFHGSWVGIYYHPVSMAKSMYGSAQLLPIFFGFNLFLMLSPHYDHRKRNSIWLSIIAAGLSSFGLLLIFVGTSQFIGYQGVALLSHPTEFVMQLVQIPGILIERFGIVLVFLVTLFEAVFVSNHLWSISSLMATVCNVKKHQWFIIPMAITIVLIGDMIPNQQIGDILVRKVLVPLSWLYLVIEPTIKLLVAYARGIDGQGASMKRMQKMQKKQQSSKRQRPSRRGRTPAGP